MGGQLVIAAIVWSGQDCGHEAAIRPRRPLRGRAEPRRERPGGGLRRRLPLPRGLLRAAHRLARRRAGPLLQRPHARPRRHARGHPGARSAPRAGRSRDQDTRPGAGRLAARPRAPRPAAGVGVHRRPAAGGGRPARRTPGHHPLVRLRDAGPDVPGGAGRPGPDLRARRTAGDVGRCHRGHRSRARPGRGGARPGRRAHRRPSSRRVPAAPRQPGPVQRPAERADRRPRTAPRRPALDHRTPRRRPLGRGARGPGRTLTPPLRPRVQGGDRPHPGPLRRARCLEQARRLLEDTADGVVGISRASGYGTPEAMRRAFVKALGTAPAEYRRRFRSHPV